MNVYQDARVVALMGNARGQKVVCAMKVMSKTQHWIFLIVCPNVIKNVSMVNAHSLTIVHALLVTQKIWKVPINVYYWILKDVQMVVTLWKANVYVVKATRKTK
jgi:hypothetical protein